MGAGTSQLQNCDVGSLTFDMAPRTVADVTGARRDAWRTPRPSPPRKFGSVRFGSSASGRASGSASGAATGSTKTPSLSGSNAGTVTFGEKWSPEDFDQVLSEAHEALHRASLEEAHARLTRERLEAELEARQEVFQASRGTAAPMQETQAGLFDGLLCCSSQDFQQCTLISENDPCRGRFRPRSAHGHSSWSGSSGVGGGRVDRSSVVMLGTMEESIAPCSVCGVAPASILEVECGHVAICTDCGEVEAGRRCGECGRASERRIDIACFLDATTGAPVLCFSCHGSAATVLALPCNCFQFCTSCFSRCGGFCPACGAEVDEKITVSWRHSVAKAAFAPSEVADRTRSVASSMGRAMTFPKLVDRDDDESEVASASGVCLDSTLEVVESRHVYR